MPAAEEGFYLSWSLSFSVWPMSKHSAKRPHGVQRTTKDFEMDINFWRKISLLKNVFLNACFYPQSDRRHRPNERMNREPNYIFFSEYLINNEKKLYTFLEK